MSLISVQSVSKSYAVGSPVLRDISFELQKGQILAILGESGSGKTTLIKIIAGLIQPDEGLILFNEDRLEGPHDKLVPGHEEIRLVHQDFNLYHRMTVEENIRNALIQYIAEYKNERTAALLDLCGIKSVKDQYVHEISGGEKQRVAIAMALATKPEVLLFDEPFSNLDFLTKTNLLQEINTIAKAINTSMILITHDSRDAMEVADRLIVLHQGGITREGTPKQVYQQPQRRHVANLLGLHTVLHPAEVDWLAKAGLKQDSYGIWAEDVLLHKPDGMQGRVKKVVFAGPVNKLLISAKGSDIWAYDYSGKINVQDKVRFSIRQDKLFSLE